MAQGKVTEYVVRVDGQPVFSGAQGAARVMEHNAYEKAMREGRAVPDVKVTMRTVDYDLADSDPAKVVEVEVQI